MLYGQDNALLLELKEKVSELRLEQDVRKLVGFGTRHTLSDTSSQTRGIGAARRWIEAEMGQISADCGGCLEVATQRSLVLPKGQQRIDTPTMIVNVYAIKRGKSRPNDYVIITGDIDSRVSDVMNRSADSPGANDNASGVAAVLEAARILAKHDFEASIILAALSGEEQGLLGGAAMAQYAKEQNWNIVGVFNNDMIGNIEGIDGITDSREFRIFSEPNFANPDERTQLLRRFYGGESDGASRQLARYVDRIANEYMPIMRPMMVNRLDRFGRGGHHRPFNDAGFAGVRIMEAHEHYDRQHQDSRIEADRRYGDVLEGVNFPYLANLTRVNILVAASLAAAPAAPTELEIGGSVAPAAQLKWKSSKGAVGYKIYYRLTTEPQWTNYFWVDGGDSTQFTATGFVVDNYNFGVAAVGANGLESVVAFPQLVSKGF